MDEDAGRSGLMKLFLLVAVVAAAVAAMLKKQREAELDEALWEEPRAL